MTQIDSAQLPHELVDIQVVAKMLYIDGTLNKVGQQAAKLALHFQNLAADAALDVIELEQARGDRTASGQACALSPSEPIANQRAQTRKAFARLHRRLDNVHCDEVRHMRQQFDLNIFFRAEVREQPAFRHSHLSSEHTERDPGEARLAHQSESVLQDAFAR